MELYYQTSDSVTLTIYVNGALQNADSVPTITITRLSDGVEIATDDTVTAVSTGKYKYTLTTAQNSFLGQFKAEWAYEVNGIPNIKTDYYDVVVGYANATQVKDLYPDLASKTNDEIYAKEKLARKIIEIFCNQSFGFRDSQTKVLKMREMSNLLFVEERLWNLDSVLINNEDDITDQVEIQDDYWLSPLIDFDAGFFTDTKRGILEPSRFFRRGLKYYVTGDWGWQSVPDNINLAAIMLINDYFCDTAMLREHGIVSYQLGEKSIQFARDLWGTTGNYDVDILLSDYVYVDVRLI